MALLSYLVNDARFYTDKSGSVDKAGQFLPALFTRMPKGRRVLCEDYVLFDWDGLPSTSLRAYAYGKFSRSLSVEDKLAPLAKEFTVGRTVGSNPET